MKKGRGNTLINRKIDERKDENVQGKRKKKHEKSD